ncbi:hypothetical protein AGMMS49944_15010 [Spirochaetia bacterium]|nr:hypothetical protein AGMMS49944_15010 [Spirochaetia bacterium]
MKCTLKDVSDLEIGLVLSRKKAPGKSLYEYQKLSLKSLGADGALDMVQNETYYASEALDGHFLTRENMVVIKLFTPLNPVVVQKGQEGFVIPSQMAGITVKKDVYPEYLQYFLSLPETGIYLLSRTSGAVMRSISVKTLSELPLDIPPLKQQEQFCSLYRLHRRKKALTEKLAAIEDEKMLAVFETIRSDNGDE